MNGEITPFIFIYLFMNYQLQNKEYLSLILNIIKQYFSKEKNAYILILLFIIEQIMLFIQNQFKQHN
ncbi:unnamed protein product [Paramecium sonneborni]|uniref:Transmembrane protein n=1 Tax=Paramecium sonneborni TaxID=65129 RepID=A0A8S1NLP7_9CILI|nr:unnamed protein product [Paramecium sonneborni]